MSHPFFFVIARYSVYGIQLVNAIGLGIALGPIAFASWAFIQLLIQYAAQLNMGIPYYLTNSLTIHGTQSTEGKVLVVKAFRLSGVWILFFLLFVLLSRGENQWGFDKYISGYQWWLVLLIAVVQQFNQLWMGIARIENRFGSIIWAQLLPQLILSILLIIFYRECSVDLMVMGLLAGQVATMLMIGKIRWSHSGDLDQVPTSHFVKESLKLLVYNAFFYLIMITTRSEMSYVLSEAQFGQFAFAFVFINMIILGMDALGFIWFPKLVRMYSQLPAERWQEVLMRSQRLFLSLAMLGIGLLVLIFPLVHQLTDKYSESSSFFYFGVFPTALYFLSFSLPALLMAQKKNHWIAWVSVAAFLLNFLVLKLGLEFSGGSARYALHVTGFVYLIQYFVFVILVKKMIKKISDDPSVQIFHWDIQGIYLLWMVLMMIAIGIDVEAGWWVHFLLMFCIVYPLARWKIWRGDMNWMNSMEEGKSHD
jgi:O-antigen/teichoic acid export membrane protein